MTPAELPAYLERLRDRVQRDGAREAASAMAFQFQRDVISDMKGPAPSPPGSPPARRSGTLARSGRVKPAAGGGPRATASLGFHAVYARIQQLGGHIHVVRAKVLTDGKRFFGKHVYLPARPYMTKTPARMAAARRAAVQAVQRVISGG